MGSTTNVRNYEQDHIGYLNLIQGNITRMAGNSALMKGFAATVLGAMLGMCGMENFEWYYVVIVLIPLVAFVRLDIYYLQLEKRYRNLYTIVARDRNQHQWDYILDLNSNKLKKYRDDIYDGTGFWKTLFSVSIWQFYIWFVILAIVFIIFVA